MSDFNISSICLCHGVNGDSCSNIAIKRRRSTNYVQEERNFVIMCDSCFEIEEQHWSDLRDVLMN